MKTKHNLISQILLAGLMLLACMIPACNTPEDSWKKTKQKNTWKVYTEYLERYPNSTHYTEARNLQNARAEIEISIGLTRGFFLLAKKDFDQAKVLFSDVKEISPHNPFALNNLGVIAALDEANVSLAKSLFKNALNATKDQTISKKVCMFAFNHNEDIIVLKSFLPSNLDIKPPVDGPKFKYFRGQIAFRPGDWVCASTDDIVPLSWGIKNNEQQL